MKLANRIFFSLIGIIIFSSLASAFLGAVLISRALKAEAFSRVSYDLKGARLYFDDLLDELALYAQLHANGGVPIPEDKIPLLFRKFSRLVKSDDGAGLGLYLIRKIVERHGGEVWCESTAEATAFYMKIPSAS